MKAGRGREKGSTFERKLAGDIVEVTGCEKRECYRTPLSGGHPFACPSDLQMSERLRKAFPFSLEAKHRKNWRLDQLFTGNKEFESWLIQSSDAASSDNQIGVKVSPLVVVRANFGNTYAVGLQTELSRFMGWDKGLRRPTRLLLKFNTKTWVMVLWPDVLKRLGAVCDFRKKTK